MQNQLLLFFDSLRTEADFERLRDESREEDLHLEFKSKEDRSNGKLSEGDRRRFSKAVSGFANADGGVLVFGVKTRKTQDTPDRAAELLPVEHVGNFRVRLLDSLLQLTQPPVDGVRIETIASASGSGYVKCLVPASDQPPHRAMFADREYWRRTSNGHRRMEHFELEDVFGRRLRPVLKLNVHFRLEQSDPSQGILEFKFKNVGRGVARYGGFFCQIIHPTAPVTIISTPGLQNVTSLNCGWPAVSYADNVGVVHPNDIYASLGQVVFRRDLSSEQLLLGLKWYAENMPMRQLGATLRPGDTTEG